MRIYGAFRSPTFLYENRWKMIKFLCITYYGKNFYTAPMGNVLSSPYLDHLATLLVVLMKICTKQLVSASILFIKVKYNSQRLCKNSGPMTFHFAYQCPTPKTSPLGGCPMVEKSWILHWAQHHRKGRFRTTCCPKFLHDEKCFLRKFFSDDVYLLGLSRAIIEILALDVFSRLCPKILIIDHRSTLVI